MRIENREFQLKLMGASALAVWAGLGTVVALADVVKEVPAERAVVTFEQFASQCANPDRSQVQRAPREIRLVCTNREVNWLAAQPGVVALPASRSVSTALLSDKFRVAAETREVPAVRRDGTCHRFEEVVETFTAEVPFTCEDISKLKGGPASINEICLSHLDEGKDKNARAVQVERTGRLVDTCSGSQSHAE